MIKLREIHSESNPIAKNPTETIPKKHIKIKLDATKLNQTWNQYHYYAEKLVYK